ncbi:MAG: preprotein translocase subunit SecG [Bacteroidales bacterium]|nr:preprotein translocase subunit SecG [Bacteroidales bacterium]
MYIFISVLILIISILLGLIVLVQNPKGGGLAANFSGGNQFMGARQTADFLEKASWGFAIALLVLTLTASIIIPRGTVQADQTNTLLQEKADQTKQPAVDFTAPPVQQQPAATPDQKKDKK